MKTAQRLEALVRGLALPEGRRVGRPGHAIAEQWVAAQMARLELQFYAGDSFALPFQNERGTAFTNFAGLICGRDQSLSPILIGAHYDSVIDAPCADDNAAAVALTLEVAARIRPGLLRHDVIVAIFDSEEPPYFLTDSMGSIHFYEHQAGRHGFHAALICDLIGHDVGFRSLGEATPEEIRRLVCVQGAESHPALPGLIESTPAPAGIAAIAVLNSYVPDLSDHHIFRIHKHPYLFLSCGLWEHYHQPSDTPEKLNYIKLAALTDWVTELMLRLDNIPLPPTKVMPDEDPTAEFESRTIAAALPAQLLESLKLPVPRGRADVSAFMGRLFQETFEVG